MPVIDFTSSAYSDPLRAMTLKALRQRQDDLAAQQAKITAPRAISSPWQGAAQVAESIGNSLQRGTADMAEVEGRKRLAQIASGFNPDDPNAQAQIAEAATLDPELYRNWSEQLLQSRRDKAARDAAIADREDTQKFQSTERVAGEQAAAIQTNTNREDTQTFTDEQRIKAADEAERIRDDEAAAAAKKPESNVGKIVSDYNRGLYGTVGSEEAKARLNQAVQKETFVKGGQNITINPDGTVSITEGGPAGGATGGTQDIKNQANAVEDYRVAAKSGNDLLPVIDNMEKAFSGAGYTGPGGDYVGMLDDILEAGGQAFGIGDAGVLPGKSGSRAVVRGGGLQFVFDSIQKSKGSISNAEMGIFASVAPGMSSTPEGAKTVLQVARIVAQRAVEREAKAREWSATHGGRLDGFEQTWNDYVNSNPVLTVDNTGQLQVAGAAPATAAPATAAPAAAAPATAPPKPGEEVDGFIFQGGNPSRPECLEAERNAVMAGPWDRYAQPAPAAPAARPWERFGGQAAPETSPEQPGFLDRLSAIYKRGKEQENAMPNPLTAMNDMVRIGADTMSFGGADWLAGNMPFGGQGSVEAERKATQEARERAGWAGTGLDVATAVATLPNAAKRITTAGASMLPNAPQWMKTGGSLLATAADAAAQGGAYSVGSNLGSDKTAEQIAAEAKNDAMASGVLGGAGHTLFGGLSKWLGRRKAAAAQPFKKSEDAKVASSAKYKSVEQAGGYFDKSQTNNLLDSIDTLDLTPGLDDRAIALRNKLNKDWRGKDMTVEEFDKTRRFIREQLVEANPRSPEGRAGQSMIRDMDQYLKSKSTLSSTTGADPAKIKADLLEGRELYSRAAKAQEVEKALAKAKRQASRIGSSLMGGNIENTTRQRIGKVSDKLEDKGLGSWSKDEAARASQIATGTLKRNIGRLGAAIAPSRGVIPFGLHLMTGFGGGLAPLAEAAKHIGTKATRREIEDLNRLILNKEVPNADPRVVAAWQKLGGRGLSTAIRDRER